MLSNPLLHSIVPIPFTELNPILKWRNSSPLILISRRHERFRCLAKKKIGFMDQILDYIEGGPKLRKWYGAPDLVSKDESALKDEDEYSEEGTIRDAILVTDGDTEMGQMVILSLIVKKARVKALVKDKQAALEAFGLYVEPVAGDIKDEPLLKKALREVRTIICPKLSNYRSASGVQALLKGNAKKLAEQDEAVLVASEIPYTIIRAGLLKDIPGGNQGFSFEEGCATTGTLSKEDAAFICVEATDVIPKGGFAFEVANGNEQVSDWKGCLTRLLEKTEQRQ
ncbi:uncharacterized protein LOC120084693 isoform X2 [Benincasa hispida]|uniref:uncharacterized protein LOC120084693 isoform X2 n=1 Tax=Benincasa hispida TaxID=102211 RepID=UPI001902607C|nr:uncharacterized protein LOC120084693 isoform X2 [Benincasa hispida]